jgi:protein-tyrosine phosphatase
MAEGLLSNRLETLGLPTRVHSAGLLAGGSPAAPEAVAALAARGIDISAHRSRRLSAPLVNEADLVLGLAREHVRQAVLAEPEAWPRSFTLKELVRRSELVGPWASGQSLEEWLFKVAGDRTHSDMLGESSADDVDDPIGGPPSAYEATAADLSELTDSLADLLRAGAG